MLCSFESCKNISRNKKKPGLCWSHYKRERKYGDPRLGSGHHRTLLGPIIKRKLKETKKAYWAGFFDGEGSVGIYCYERGVSYRATISQLPLGSSTLYEIASVYDASIGEYSRSSGSIVTMQLCGLRAYEFLHDIFPYLTVKKEQTRVFLSHVEEIRSRGYDRKSTESVSSKLKELKRR